MRSGVTPHPTPGRQVERELNCPYMHSTCSAGYPHKPSPHNGLAAFGTNLDQAGGLMLTTWQMQSPPNTVQLSPPHSALRISTS